MLQHHTSQLPHLVDLLTSTLTLTHYHTILPSYLVSLIDEPLTDRMLREFHSSRKTVGPSKIRSSSHLIC
jgi:hypothetical protein